jgi:1-deoxy-D-xylulose-5-phosphate reductoisomerase
MKNIVILGATGSIGTQTIDVVRSLPDKVRAIGLSAHSKWQELFGFARELGTKFVSITDERLRGAVDAASIPPGVELLWGDSGVRQMVSDAETNVVVAGMVGAAGLRGTMHALQAGKDVALANKESLVVGGPIVTEMARAHGCQLLPVDSEHSAIFQCLQAGGKGEVERIILTASGGPFRTRPLNTFDAITPAEALEHPTWNMGPKITIDSATMMNKALEIIEAHWLFGLPAERIAVILHPQSMVHSMVEFVDGSVIAQISPPDMRLPIQYALTCPERMTSPARKLNLAELGSWTFESPDFERYPALRLGYEVVRRAGTSGAALNAANEVAVERFLHGDIRFRDITALCDDILRVHPHDARPTLDGLLTVDRWARQEASCWNRSTSLKS